MSSAIASSVRIGTREAIGSRRYTCTTVFSTSPKPKAMSLKPAGCVSDRQKPAQNVGDAFRGTPIPQVRTGSGSTGRHRPPESGKNGVGVGPDHLVRPVTDRDRPLG